MRGLKPITSALSKELEKVAPHTGAWIETGKVVIAQYDDGVAPHTGAWIETHLAGRGRNTRKVAPHTGAWIETRV